jgi:hypothetical protein
VVLGAAFEFRLVPWFEKNGLFHEGQNGSRKKRSCAHNLILLLLATHGKLITIFMDIRKAYPTAKMGNFGGSSFCRSRGGTSGGHVFLELGEDPPADGDGVRALVALPGQPRPRLFALEEEPLPRPAVTSEQGRALAESSAETYSFPVQFAECSAKTGANVQQASMRMVPRMIEQAEARSAGSVQITGRAPGARRPASCC